MIKLFHYFLVRNLMVVVIIINNINGNVLNVGNEFEDTCFSHIPRCLICEPLINGFSYSELELLAFVKEYFPNAKKDRKLLAPKEIDILIPELKLGIEFNR